MLYLWHEHILIFKMILITVSVGLVSKWKGDGIAVGHPDQKHANQLWRYMYLNLFWVPAMINEVRWWVSLQWISLKPANIHNICLEILIAITFWVVFHIKNHSQTKLKGKKPKDKEKVAHNLLFSLLHS